LVHQLAHLGFEVQLHVQQTPAVLGSTPTLAGGS